MIFNSIKEINGLRKELNRSISKGMLSTYLKVTMQTFLDFLGLKNL